VAGFSEFFAEAHPRIEAWAALSEPPLPLDSILEAAELGGGLGTEQAASLMAWGRNPDHQARIRAAASRARRRWAGNAVEFIIPVYLTSFCQNECLYCGYRKSNPIAERIRLSLEDLGRELDVILAWGHRQIELVLSEDPGLGPAELARYVELTRRKLDGVGGGVIALCSPVYAEGDYARLREAGLDWVAEWQETYHQPHFDRWHSVGSPKREYEYRLDIWDRAIAAGLSKIGLGALLGLYDWRYDVLAAIEHGNYLRKTYALEPHALGIPRLKPARGVLASQKPSRFTVSDDDFRLIVSLYHLAFPRTRLFFNTREAYELNLSMLAGGDLLTVDCETLPGGYLRPHLPGQFSTHDYPSRREVVAELERRGLSCRYLAAESASPEAPPRLPEVRAMDLKRWSEDHQEIRSRLRDWESILAWLESGLSQRGERQAAEAALRMVLHFLRTFVSEHCREEENVLFASFPGHATKEQLQDLRSYHERFSVDLDRFDRQVASYQLSGDPSVLLTLGARIIREAREHMEAEEALFEQTPAARGENARPLERAGSKP